MSERWKLKAKPASMEARFEFESFQVLRVFLDEIAEVAESLNHHPNLSFAKSHVSVIIYSQSDELDETDKSLAKSIDESFDRVITDSKGILV